MCGFWALGWPSPPPGPNARIVPLHLDDTALLDLIRPGDVVDVLAAGVDAGVDVEAAPQVVATDAVVVLVSEKPTGAGSGGDRVVLVALPAHDANEVAGAALVSGGHAHLSLSGVRGAARAVAWSSGPPSRRLRSRP